MATINTNTYLLGTIHHMDLETKIIYLTSSMGVKSYARIFDEEHFLSLLTYYLYDLEKVVTYQPVGEYGFGSVDVQIFSWTWYGLW